MKTTILLIAALFALSCETAPKDSPARSTEIRVHRYPVPAEARLTGRNFYIQQRDYLPSISAEFRKKAEAVLRAELVSLGFKEVPSHRKAHLVAGITSDRFYLNGEGQGYALNQVTASQAAELGFFQTARLFVIFAPQAYGERLNNFASVVFESPGAEWTGYEAPLLEALTTQLKGVMIKAPDSDQKMKGDPGCYPRFGFDNDTNGKVVVIVKGSPADRAGIKVGDLLLAIDSQEVGGEKTNYESVYKNFEKVPVKLKRGEEILRKEMKPTLLCD
jgi:hypothetical protein